MDKDSLISKLAEAEVAIIEFESITKEVINSAKSLKIIAACRNEPAANTDIDAATARNIPVLFTPGRNAVAVAEYTLGLMISIARGIPTTHHLLRYTDDLTSVSYADKAGDRKGVTSEWSLDPDAPFQRFQGDELMGKTVGVVGASISAICAEASLNRLYSKILLTNSALGSISFPCSSSSLRGNSILAFIRINVEINKMNSLLSSTFNSSCWWI